MVQPKVLGLIALSLFVLASVVEWLWMRRCGRPYPGRNLLVTLGIGAGQRLTSALWSGLTIAIFSAVGSLQSFQFSMERPIHWLALFLLFELCYYWFHRASHRANWMWATHMVHHSSEELYLPAAIRLGWTGFLSFAWVFWLPLLLFGFPAKAILLMLGFNLVYQFVLHTEAIPKLGWLEKVLNTPSHHRVHHGSNECYLDCNYGGVLIIYDRIFGTLVREQAGVRISYGLTTPLKSSNPVIIALAGWAALFAAVRRERALIDRLKIPFAAPGPARVSDPQAQSVLYRQLVHCGVVVGPVLVAAYLSEIFQRGLFLLPDLARLVT